MMTDPRPDSWFEPDEYEEWVHCEHCDDGFVGHDCGEDCCPCLEPEPNVVCDICDGEGGWKPKPLDVAVQEPKDGK